MDERPYLFVDFRREVLRYSGEGGFGAGIGRPVPADEPVGNVDVVDPVLLGAVLLEEVGHLDAQLREFRGFLAPGLVAVNVREGGDGTALEDVQPGIELGLAAGGEPEELGDEAGADDGRLLAFDQSNRFLGKKRQQVLTEQALCQRPFLRKLAGVFEEGMHPGDAAFGVLVLDAVAGLGIVFHDLAGAASALDVNLVEDDGFLTRDPDAVFLDEGGNRYRVKKGAEKGDEIGVEGGADAPGNNVVRDGVHFVHRVDGWTGWTLVDRLRFPVGPGMTGDFSAALEMTIIVLARPGFRVVLEVLAGGVVVAAAGLVVASANGLVERIAVVVDVEGEAALPATAGASVTGGRACIFLEVIVVFHCCRVLF